MLAYIFASKYLHNMEARRDVFQAIADPTRRAIIGMIAQQPVNVNTIAEQFDVSRQAISLHLKILSECGLLNIKQIGRERLSEAKYKPRTEGNHFSLIMTDFQARGIKALKDFVEQEELQSVNADTTSKKKTNSINKPKK